MCAHVYASVYVCVCMYVCVFVCACIYARVCVSCILVGIVDNSGNFGRICFTYAINIQDSTVILPNYDAIYHG